MVGEGLSKCVLKVVVTLLTCGQVGDKYGCWYRADAVLEITLQERPNIHVPLLFPVFGQTEVLALNVLETFEHLQQMSAFGTFLQVLSLLC
jgi:hypothetical protein